MSDNPPRFADFGKSVKDLLFPTPSGFDLNHAVKLESKARNQKDIKFNAEWTQKPDQSVSGKLAAEWAHSCGGTVKAAIATDNVKTVDASYKDIVPGLVLSASGVQGAQDAKKPDAISVGARYFRQYVDGEVKVGAYGPHNVEASVAVGARGFFAGAKGIVNVAGTDADGKSTAGQIKAYDLAATYRAKEFEVVATAEQKLSVFKAGFLHHVNSSLDIAAQVEYKKGAETSKAVTYIVGAGVKHDGATIKSRLDSNGLLQGSYSAPVQGATVTLVGRVSTVKRDAKENGIGLQIALK